MRSFVPWTGTGLVLALAGFTGLAAFAPANQPEVETVTVTITTDAVTLSPDSVQQGETEFNVTNETSVPYELDIDGPGPDGELENIPAGATRTLNMTLRPGTYEVESEPENDSDRERHAYLTVTD